MAAGMGSRYGGLKQLDKVGPSGETIIDYSIHDAVKAGFTKVIFIIRRDFEDQFKLQITNKYLGKFAVEFAFQDIDDLPNGFSCPSGREKPWGTGQAILSARNLINEPFVVINGVPLNIPPCCKSGKIKGVIFKGTPRKSQITENHGG